MNALPPTAERALVGRRRSARWFRPATAELAFIWAAFAAVLAMAVWSAPRGFDFLDSGVYYLEYKYPDDIADRHTSYWLFARPFFLLVGENITGFRFVSWVVLWASASVLAWGWVRHLQAIHGNERLPLSAPAIFGLFLLASCAVYTIKPAALTYNSLNFVGVCVALGLLFDAAARFIRDEQGWRGVAEVAAAALAATLDLLVKPTTAAFLLAVIAGYCVVSPGISRQNKVRLTVMAVAAGALGTLAMIVFVGGIGPFLERARTLTSILENRAYMDELNTRTLREFRELGAFLWQDLRWAGAALAGTAAVVLALRWRPSWTRWAAAAGGGLIVVLWLHGTYRAELWRGSHQLYFDGVVARLYLGAAVLAAAMTAVSVMVLPHRLRPVDQPKIWGLKLLLWLILMVTPFAGAYGSTTTVYLNGALYSVCWLGAVLLAVFELARIWGSRWVVTFAVAPIALYAVAQLYHGQIHMPYMNPRPLWEQTVPTVVGNERSILLLDQPASDFINEVRTVLTAHGFKPGDDIFCFFNIPGLVYAVGGRSPVIPWYFGRIYVGNPVEEIYMQAAGPERRRHAWIITQAEVTQFREHFVRGGIDFPDGYEEIGALMNPQSGLEVKVWKPRDVPTS